MLPEEFVVVLLTEVESVEALSGCNWPDRRREVPDDTTSAGFGDAMGEVLSCGESDFSPSGTLTSL